MNNSEENKELVTPINPENVIPVESNVSVQPEVSVIPEESTVSVENTSVVTATPVEKQVDTTLVVENPQVQPATVQETVQTPESVPPVVPVEPTEEDDNKGPSTFAKIMTVLLFIFLFAFVYFLGDITDFINEKKLEKQNAEIMNGRLICSNEKTTENLDVQISATFTFENKQITNLTFITTSTGDKTKDQKELEELKEQCTKLKEVVKDYKGVSVVCSLNSGINSVKQIFDYSVLEADTVRASFAEAGGVYPQFKYKDDINSVESKMISSDYMCEKVRG